MLFGKLHVTVEASSAQLEEHMEPVLLLNATASSSLLLSLIMLETSSPSTVLLCTRICALGFVHHGHG